MSFKQGLNSFAYTAAFPYAIPTMVRQIGKALDKNKSPDIVSDIPLPQVYGIVAGITTYGLAVIGAVTAIKEGYPEYILPPIATNLLSYLYESVHRKTPSLEQKVVIPSEDDPEAVRQFPLEEPRVRSSYLLSSREAVPGKASHLD